MGNVLHSMQRKALSFAVASAALAASAALVAACALSAVSASPAFADTISGGDGWEVVCTEQGELESTFTSSEVDEVLGSLQPGDVASVRVELRSEYPGATDWYLLNSVLSSLEESSSAAVGGAYGYVLEYVDPAGTSTTLFSSDAVGGERAVGAREGLTQATIALEDYVFLGTLQEGETAEVHLTVTLDGETQGNGYQDTLAAIAFRFAAEPQDGGTAMTEGTIAERLAQTGDKLLGPIAAAALVAGAALLAVGIARARREGAAGAVPDAREREER